MEGTNEGSSQKENQNNRPSLIHHQASGSEDLRSSAEDENPIYSKSLVQIQSPPQYDKFDLLQKEYLLIMKFCPSGMYVIPCVGAIERWNGVLFINAGIYSRAIFKFTILFDDYPFRLPTVYFQNEIFHPLIRQVSGELDLAPGIIGSRGSRMPNVVAKLKKAKESNLASQPTIATDILEYIKKIFLFYGFFEIMSSKNPIAGEVWNTDRDKYLKIARETIKKSLEIIFDNHPSSSLHFNMNEGKSTDDIKNKLQELAGTNPPTTSARDDSDRIPRPKGVDVNTFFKWLDSYCTVKKQSAKRTTSAFKQKTPQSHVKEINDKQK